jgi:alpha-tubulin suppressor-like RCC1 family protein
MPVSSLAKIQSLAAGATHVLALSIHGEVFAWGSNNKGQLGTKMSSYSNIPIKVPFSEKISAVAAGLHFSLALSESGSVYAWGWNGFGQLGLSDYKDRTLPTKIKGLAKVKSISAGHTYAVAITSKELLGWGNNNSGQIGGTAAKVNSPDSFLSIA